MANDQTDCLKGIMLKGLSDELLTDLKKYASSQNANGYSSDLWGKLKAEVEEPIASYVQIFIYKASYKRNDYINYNVAVLKTIMKYKSGEDVELFDELLRNVNIEQLVESLRYNCKDKQNPNCFKFVHGQLVPMVFNNSTPKKTLDALIDLLLLMPAGFAYEHMTEASTKTFKRDIMNKYIPNIDPVNPKSMNWWRLCKVLIHYCGRILHNEIELTNTILRLVEIGFKTKTVEDRCGSYECWKELIDNYNLDKKYLKNSKQIRLLIKPLKAKLSRNCQVSVKRFEAYASLIEKLENFSVPCIEDFLVFCFGPLSEDFNGTGNEHLLNPGRSVKEVFPRSTEILLKLLGHNLNKENCCQNKNAYLTDIYKIQPFLDGEILPNYATVFISCIRICSELTLQWINDSNRDIVINCLWSSFFRLLIHVPDSAKLEILQTIRRNIQAIIKKCDCDNMYYSILKVILRSVLYYLDEIPYLVLTQSELVSPIIQDISALENKVPELSTKMLNDFQRDFLNYSTLNPGNFEVEIDKLFKNTAELSPNILIFYLDYTSNMSVEYKGYADSRSKIIDFLMSLITSNSPQCIDYWKVATESSAFSALHLELCFLKKFVILLQSSPQHTSIVLDICWMFPRFCRKNGEEFFNNLLSLICKCLSLPTLKINKEHVLASFKNVEEIRNKHKYKTNENFFKCLEFLLKPHQVYEMLSILKNIINGMDNVEKDNIPKGLKDVLLDQATHSDEEISGNALTVLTKLGPKFKNTEVNSNVPISRSARITNMVIKECLTTPIRLLGQEVESPHKIRKSLINITTKTLSPKPANQMPVFTKKQNNLNDLSEKDFVVIDKEVKLQPDKLSVHQKEMLKKRRDNIPALYQDLSQSISQSLDVKIADSNQEEIKLNGANDKNEPTDDVKERKVLEKLPSEDENKNTDECPSDGPDLNRRAVKRALNSLRLDIVDAEAYHQNLPKKRQVKRTSWALSSMVSTEGDDDSENDTKTQPKAKAGTPSENIVPRKRKLIKDKQEKKDKEKKASPGRKKKLISSSNSEDDSKIKKNPPGKRGRKKSVKPVLDEPKNKEEETILSPKSPKNNVIEGEEIRSSDTSTEILSLPSDTKEESFTTTILVPSQDSNVSIPEEIPSQEISQNNIINNNPKPCMNNVETQNEVKIDENSSELFIVPSPTSSKSKCVSPKSKVFVEKEGNQDSEDLIIPSSQPSPKKCFSNVRVSLFRYDFKDLSPEKLSEQQKLCGISTDPLDDSIIKIQDTETLDPYYDNVANRTSEMDTESMDVTSDVSSMDLAVEETPKKQGDKDELACSPVTKETPNKNSVLMNDTCDISPIKLTEVQLAKTTQEETNNEICIKENIKIPDELAVLKAPSSRSAKLLNLLPQAVPMKLHKPLLETGIRNTVNISSPKTDRIRKMMMNCEEQSKIDFIVLEDDNSIKLNGKDVLKFDREVPSPLATPKISILKRKFPDTAEEGISPCAKRKRVNFSDPPITCEKIYFKEHDEKSSFFKKTRRKSIIKSMSPKQDSIKSIQYQIDSLGTDGVSPLPDSPPKEQNDEENYDGTEIIQLEGDADLAQVLFIDELDEKEENDVEICVEQEPVNPEYKMADEFIQTIERTLAPQNFHLLLIKQIEKHIDVFCPEERKRLVAAIVPKS